MGPISAATITTETLVTEGLKYGGKAVAKQGARMAVNAGVWKLTQKISARSEAKSIGTSSDGTLQSDLDRRLAIAGEEESGGITLNDFFAMVGKDKYKNGVLTNTNSNKGAVRFVRSKDKNGRPSVSIAKVGNKVDMGWCFRQNVYVGHNKALRKLFGERLLEAWSPFFKDGQVSKEYGESLELSLQVLKGLAHGWGFESTTGAVKKDSDIILVGPTNEDAEAISGKRLGRMEIKQAKLYSDYLSSEDSRALIAKSFLRNKLQAAGVKGVSINDMATFFKTYASPAFDALLSKEKPANDEDLSIQHLINYIVFGSVNGKKVSKASDGNDQNAPEASLVISEMKGRMDEVSTALNTAVEIAGLDQAVDAIVDNVTKDSGAVPSGMNGLKDLVTKLIRSSDKTMGLELKEAVKISKATENFLEAFFGSSAVGGKTRGHGYIERVLDSFRTVQDKPAMVSKLKELLHFSNIRKIHDDYVAEFEQTSEDNSIAGWIGDMVEVLKEYNKKSEEAKAGGNVEAHKEVQEKIENVEQQVLELVKLVGDKTGMSNKRIEDSLRYMCKDLSGRELYTDKQLEAENARRMVPLKCHTLESLMKIFKDSLANKVTQDLADTYRFHKFLQKHKELVPNDSLYFDDVRLVMEHSIEDCSKKFLGAVNVNTFQTDGLTIGDVVSALRDVVTKRLLPMGDDAKFVQTSLNALMSKAVDALTNRVGKLTIDEANKMADALNIITRTLADTLEFVSIEDTNYKEAVVMLSNRLTSFIRRGAITANMKASLEKSVQSQTLAMTKGLAISEFLDYDLDDFLKDIDYQTLEAHVPQFMAAVKQRIVDRLKVNARKSVNYGYQLFYSGVLNQSNGEFAMSVTDLEKRLATATNPDGGKDSSEASADSANPGQSLAQAFYEDTTKSIQADDAAAEKQIAPGAAESVAPQDGVQQTGAQPTVAQKPVVHQGGLQPGQNSPNHAYFKKDVNKITDAFTAFIRKSTETGLGGDALSEYVSAMRGDGRNFHPLSLDQQMAAQRAHVCDMWAEQVLSKAPGQLPEVFEVIRDHFGKFVNTNGILNWGKSAAQKAENLQKWRFTPISDPWLRSRLEGLTADMRANIKSYRAFEGKFVASCRTCVEKVLEAIRADPENSKLSQEDRAAIKAFANYSPDAMKTVVDNILSGLTDRLAPFMLEYSHAPKAYEDLAKDSGKINALVAKLLGMPPRYGEKGLDIAESAKAVAGDSGSPIMQSLVTAIQIRTKNVTSWLRRADIDPGNSNSDQPGFESDQPGFGKTESEILKQLNGRADVLKRKDDGAADLPHLFPALVEQRLAVLRAMPLTAANAKDFNAFVADIADSIWNESLNVVKDKAFMVCLETLKAGLSESTMKLNDPDHDIEVKGQLAKFQRRAVATLIESARTGMLAEKGAETTFKDIMSQFKKDVDEARKLVEASTSDQVRARSKEIPELQDNLRTRLLKAGFNPGAVEMAVYKFVRQIVPSLEKKYKNAKSVGESTKSWRDEVEEKLGQIGNSIKNLGEWQTPDAWAQESLKTLGGEGKGNIGSLLTSEIADRARMDALEDSGYKRAVRDLAEYVVKDSGNQKTADDLKMDLKKAYTAAFEKSCRQQAYAELVDAERQKVSFTSLADHMIKIGKDDWEKIEQKLHDLDKIVAYCAAKNSGAAEFRPELNEGMTQIKIDIWMLAHAKDVKNGIDKVREAFIAKLKNEAESPWSDKEREHQNVRNYLDSLDSRYREKLRAELKKKLELANGELPNVALSIEDFMKNSEFKNEIDDFTNTGAIDFLKGAIKTSNEAYEVIQEANSSELTKFLTELTKVASLFNGGPSEAVSNILKNLFSIDVGTRQEAFATLYGLVDNAKGEKDVKQTVFLFFNNIAKHGGERDCKEIFDDAVKQHFNLQQVKDIPQEDLNAHKKAVASVISNMIKIKEVPKNDI